jgi:hypothetical protein
MISPHVEAKGHTGLLRSAAALVVWVGGSVGALTAILGAMGYLVEGGFMAAWGLSRGTLELSSAEYVASGGQFVLGLLPVATVGALNVVWRHGWTLALVAATLGLLLWRRAAPAWRWGAMALSLLGALGALLPALERVAHGSEANGLVAMLHFVALAGLVYAAGEHLRARASGGVALRLGQLAYYALLSVVLLTLPYARGSKGLPREMAAIQLPPTASRELCLLARPGATAEACAEIPWRLVQLGKDRSLLLDAASGSLFVVPAKLTETMRVLRQEGNRP